MIFKPESFLKRIFPSGFWNRSLLNKDLDFKQTAKRAILKATSLSGREVDATVDKVIKLYEHKRDLIDGTADVEKITNNGALLRQRLENLILYNEIQEQKEEHKGEYYRWLPSSAETPDPEHQLLYGKIFKVGEGDKDGNMPSERYGCRCGMELLTDAEKKDIEARLGNKKITVKQDKTKNIDNAVKMPDEFMPAETIAEAKAYTNKFMQEGKTETWGNVKSLENINVFNKTLEELTKKYGESDFETLGSARGRSYWAHANGKLLEVAGYFGNYNKKQFENEFFNSVTNYQKYYSDILEKWRKYADNPDTTGQQLKQALKKIDDLEKLTKWKRHNVISSAENMLKDVITHEYGHTLMFRKIRKEREAGGTFEVDYGIRKAKFYNLSEQQTKTWELVKDTLHKARKNGDIYEISAYSNTNPHEFFAESFAMREIGEKLPDYIEKMLKEVTGK